MIEELSKIKSVFQSELEYNTKVKEILKNPTPEQRKELDKCPDRSLLEWNALMRNMVNKMNGSE